MLTEYKTEIPVRYAETDQMGAVHHSAYIIYFEAARVEHLKASGLPYDELERRGFMLPVIDLGVKYLKSARFGQTVEVISRILPVKGIRLRVEYSILFQSDLLATGYSVHAFINAAGAPVRPPKDVVLMLS